MTTCLKTALYERLSRDDENYGDSVSIAHQKVYLRSFADKNGYTNCVDYTDDGWTGANFERPAWNQLIADIESGEIAAVIVKDLSRVGRDHLMTGFYTEVYFAQKGVHFIAIDNRVDNQSNDSNEFAPFLNVFNELYLHDQSRKVTIGFHAKGVSGKSLCSIPNFGYIRDSEDKNRWIIEPAAAETVRRIFQLAADGANPNQIARILQEENRMTPAFYFDMRGDHRMTEKQKSQHGPYVWSRSSVVNILKSQVYIGKIVNFKTAKDSYKGKRKKTSSDQQVVIENHHEPMVDQTTWDASRAALNNANRHMPKITNSPWNGKIFCAECGAPMRNIHHSFVMKTGNVCNYDFFTCPTNAKGRSMAHQVCSKNYFSKKMLIPLLQEAIRRISQIAIEDEESFREKLREQEKLHQPEQIKPLKKEIVLLEKRISEIKRLLKKLYEDYALDKISEEHFSRISDEYEQEQNAAETALDEMKHQLQCIQSENGNTDKFLALARKYRDTAELTEEQLLEFIDRVLVHKTEKDADGERSREIEIHFNFIGQFIIPPEPIQLTPEEEKRQAQLKHRRIHERDKRARKRAEQETQKAAQEKTTPHTA